MAQVSGTVSGAGARRRVAITGLGAVSGFGVGAEALWRGLLAGSRATHPGTAEAVAPGERATAMALAAAKEAVADAGGVIAGPTLSVVVGTTLGDIGGWLEVVRGRRHPTAPSTGWTWAGPARAIAAAYQARGVVRTCSVACASANAALGAALDEVRAGRARQVIVGGVDVLSDFVLVGFASLRAVDPQPCRPFDRRRAGLNLGEGAGFLVVEDEEHALARGARVRAYLDGSGDASDAHHMTGPDPEGRGAARAMLAALADAGLTPDEVEFVSAHGTATRFNDLMEAKALGLVLGERARRVPLHSIKGALGHTLGAAGAFEALVCVRQFETGWVVPTLGHGERDPAIDLDVVANAPRELHTRNALSTSSGFGGTNAAILLRAASPRD